MEEEVGNRQEPEVVDERCVTYITGLLPIGIHRDCYSLHNTFKKSSQIKSQDVGGEPRIYLQINAYSKREN